MDPDLPRPTAALTERLQATDAALAARLALGDVDALEPIYCRHKGAVYRFALLWSGSPSTAADVTQDVFVHLLTRASDYDPARGSLSPWLIGIARNFVRRRARLAESPIDTGGGDDDPLPALAVEHSTPESAVLAGRDLEALRRAIAALPPHYRDVLVLVELAERSYAEAAAICGIELNTVRSRLFRARALLARHLDIATPTRSAGSGAA